MMLVKILAATCALVAYGAAVPLGNAACDCSGTTPKEDGSAYLCKDSRLGPVDIKGLSVLGSITKNYKRLGDLCPGSFLARWTSVDLKYKYPEQDGFQLDGHRMAIKQMTVLCPGTMIDRFGSENGAFLSPAGMPYEARAIPPQNLDTFPNSAPFNYYVYRVVKELTVTAGCIAPWFEQPGLGIQYLMPMSVAAALRDGFIERANATKCAPVVSEQQAGAACKPLSLKCPGFSTASRDLSADTPPIARRSSFQYSQA